MLQQTLFVQLILTEKSGEAKKVALSTLIPDIIVFFIRIN